MQPLSGSGNIPWVDRDFKWTQHNVNVADTWTMSPTMINQLKFTYTRQFGGRVNNPATSLGDLNSNFKIQGDPSLPRLTVTGYFTAQTAIAGPDAGSDYWSVRDNVTVSKGNHSFKFGGEVSYEKIVHDTLLDNYGVFAFNGSKTGNAYADFLLGLPATMSQDAPVRKLDNGAYYSVFAQDDYRIHSRVTLNLGLRYDVQMPLTDPFDRKLAFVPGAQVDRCRRTRPKACCSPATPAIGRGIVKTDLNNIAPRLGMAWDVMGDGRTSVRAAGGVFYGSITGNEWNTTADNQPFTVRQSIPTVFTLSDPYRNLPGGVGPFPFEYDPSSPRFTYPGAGVRSVARFRLAEDLSGERHGGAAGDARSQRHGVVRDGARPQSAGEHRSQLPGVRSRRDGGERQFAAARTSPACSARCACSNRSSRSDYHALQMSAEQRGARFSAKAYYTFGTRRRRCRLPGRRPARGAELEQDRPGARPHLRRSPHSFTFSGIYTVDHFGNSSPVVKALLQRLDDFGDRHAAERHAADDHSGSIATSTA